jgi:hypothetical protein
MILVVFLRATLVYHHYMMCLLTRNPIPFDQPATYQIDVLGRIDPITSDLLGGMTITPDTTDADPPVTTLEGELRDQAALAGVLNTLYELHLLVLSVKCLKSVSSNGVPANNSTQDQEGR